MNVDTSYLTFKTSRNSLVLGNLLFSLICLGAFSIVNGVEGKIWIAAIDSIASAMRTDERISTYQGL